MALRLAEDAKPWAAALHFETLVDGEPWHGTESITSVYPPGASCRGRGADLLYAICGARKGAFSGVGTGSHRVVLRATLPGTPLVLDTPATTIRLECAADGCAVGGSVPPGSSALWLALALAVYIGRRRGRSHPRLR